jgi:hypothetical protein
MPEALRLTPRNIAEEVSTDAAERVERVLIVVHGIRDRGGWSAYFKDAMEARGYKAVVAPVVYPRYSALPFLLGKGVASRRKATLEQISRIFRDHPGAVIDVFCHSNGTKLFAEIAADIDQPLHSVVLAGSICRRRDVEAIADKVKLGRLWNFCGVRDRWPLVACALRPDLFEHTGVDGFVHERVNDRFHDFGHGGAIEPAFIKDTIIPLLLYGENPKGIPRPSVSGLHDPATYRKFAAALLGGGIFTLCLLPWWFAALTGAALGYAYYRWPEED